MKTFIKINELSKKQLNILELCYCGILNSKDNLIDKASYKNLDLEETCDVPQSIREIKIINTAISVHLEINGKSCLDPSIEW